MTFCRRGNDYADVAQPFPLTGGSHGGGGDTVDVASETSDRHVPSPPPCSTLPLVLSLAFSWMMEEPLSSTPFKTTKSSGRSNQIQDYFHLMSKRILKMLNFCGSSAAGSFHWNQGIIWEYRSPPRPTVTSVILPVIWLTDFLKKMSPVK